MPKQKIIIDTDPGIDDAMAILFACLHPDIEVVGLTSVFGNVTTQIATRNALYLAELADQNIPVATGAGVPYVQPPNPVSDYVHGVEGFGDLPAQSPKASAVPETAAEFICRMARENPGEITLCPIGPLTNIALALDHDPEVAQNLKSVVLMGGSWAAGGNVTNFAEANIWNDPHAADAVFAADWDVTMVGLDVTQKVICNAADFQALIPDAPIMGKFLSDAAQYYIAFYKQAAGIDGCYLHDPAAIIAALRPELFSVENHAVEVIVENEQIGETKLADDSKRSTSKICVDIQGTVVKELFLSTLKTGF